MQDAIELKRKRGRPRKSPNGMTSVTFRIDNLIANRMFAIVADRRMTITDFVEQAVWQAVEQSAPKTTQEVSAR